MTLLKVAGVTVVSLIVFDVLGAWPPLVLDLFSADDAPSAEVYVLWFVLGVFCGLANYQGGVGALRAASERPVRAGRIVLGMTMVVAATALCALHRYVWPTAPVYVPDSESLTFTFVLTIVATGVFAHRSRDRITRSRIRGSSRADWLARSGCEHFESQIQKAGKNLYSCWTHFSLLIGDGHEARDPLAVRGNRREEGYLESNAVAVLRGPVPAGSKFRRM